MAKEGPPEVSELDHLLHLHNVWKKINKHLYKSKSSSKSSKFFFICIFSRPGLALGLDPGPDRRAKPGQRPGKARRNRRSGSTPTKQGYLVWGMSTSLMVVASICFNGLFFGWLGTGVLIYSQRVFATCSLTVT